MKYKHNYNDKRAKLEQKLGRAIDILWGIDFALVALVIIGWVLMTFVYAPCVPGGICVGHLFTLLIIFGLIALMFLVAIGALTVFAVSRVRRVNLGSDVWKLLAVGVTWAVVLAVLALFTRF